MTQKIATCCYCGTRAALVLDRARHELTCASCGAPLREMKSLPREKQATAIRPAPAHPAPLKRTRKKPKKRKSLGRRLLSEVWDKVEDIFD